MNNSSEDTYRKLKHKVPYREACIIYSTARIELGSTVSWETTLEIINDRLSVVGWTIEELFDESFLLENSDNFESKYG